MDGLILAGDVGGTKTQLGLFQHSAGNLELVRDHRYANTSDAIERTSPRIVSAIAELARQFHPEAFVNSGTGASTPPSETSIPKNPDGATEKSKPAPPQAQLESIGIAECACAR